MIQKAGESSVYRLDGERILRLTGIDLTHYEDRAALHREIADAIPYRVPRMLDGGVVEGFTYTIEERIPGRSLDHALPEIEGARRDEAFRAFVAAAVQIGSVDLGRDWYGEMLNVPPIRTESWRDYLISRARANAAIASDEKRRDLPDLDGILDRFAREVADIDDPPHRLAHGDYFAGNVMIDDDLRITGVIDWSFLTVCGDPRLDLAACVIFSEVPRKWRRPGDIETIHACVVDQDPTVEDVLPIYRTFYALDLFAFGIDAGLYGWCVETLLGEERA